MSDIKNDIKIDVKKLFKLDEKSKTVSFNGHYTKLIPLLKERPAKNENKLIQNEILADDYSRFAGGSVQDALNNADMKPFNTALNDMKKNKALAFLKPDQANVSQSRKRVKSEHEGDYDLDRRWDIQPFNATKRILSPVQHVTVNANLSIRAQYKSYDIDQFGAIVWSVIQYLESKNIKVTVNAFNKSTYNERSNFKGFYNLVIKEPTKYVSPQSLASVFRSVFYRRVIFNAKIIGADVFGYNPGYGLGAPVECPSVVYDKGILTLSIGSIHEPESLSRELQKIFGKVS